MAKPKIQYVCDNCGYISSRYLGKCPNCGEWNTFVEKTIEKPDTNPKHRVRENLEGVKAKPELVTEIKTQNHSRIKLNSEELNQVFGGGIVPGSLILIGGSPGIGKSTLLLQLSNELSSKKQKVLYVSGEESASQIKLRAGRLKIKPSQALYIYPETDMTAIKQAISQLHPEILIIDSVQTMQEKEVDSIVGSVSQIKAVTDDLMTIAKTNGITTFVVGHITKGGNLAGPKTLEHMVDTVLYFEGDLNHSYRLLRAVKNRFGSTNELGIFEMNENGLKAVKNPSEVFLDERLENVTGSAVVVAREGSRSLLVEIQALLTPTVYGNPQRTAAGIDRNRLSLIMAVLEKRSNVKLQNQDAYIKVVGGVKLNEPAIDLAIAISVVSSYKDISTDAKECYIGEIGLTGEVRRVSQIKQRIKEAQRMGFKQIIIPKINLEDAKQKDFPSIDIKGVATLNDALALALKKK